MLLCNASNREPTDYAGNVSEMMTGNTSRSSSVEQHLDHIRLEFRRMQRQIDSLGCDKVELEQLISGSKDHKVLNDIDLLQMVSSTVMHLEENGNENSQQDEFLSNVGDSQTNNKATGEPFCVQTSNNVTSLKERSTGSAGPLCVQTAENRTLLKEHSSGSAEPISVRASDKRALLKEHSSGPSKSQASERMSSLQEHTSGHKQRKTTQLSTMNRYKAAQEHLPSFEPTIRQSVKSINNSNTESMIEEHRDHAIANRRQDRLQHFQKIQEACGGAITAQSLQSFVVSAAGDLLDITLLDDMFEVIAEKSNTGQGYFSSDFPADSQALDFDAFMQILDLKDVHDWVPDAGLDVRECILVVKQVLTSEANKVLQQSLREGMASKLRPPSFQGGVMAVLDVVSIIVILLNTLAIGIQSGSEGNTLFWDISEFVFFVFYCSEALLKAYTYGWSGFMHGIDRLWNRLDLVLLLLSTVDLVLQLVLESSDGGGQLQLLKIMRLARLARLVRVMRFKLFKELKVMILGLFSGLRALIWAVILLLLLIYVGGIVMVSIAEDEDKEFNTLDKAMFTLFRCFTDGCAAYDGTPLTERLREKHGWLFFVAWILTTMIVTVGIFNLIMAVFIDNVTKSQQQRKQKELGESADMIDTDLKLLITKFLTDPEGQAGRIYLKPPSLSAAAWSKLSTLTEVGKARDLATKQKLAATYFQILKDDAVTISRDVFQMWLEDGEFMATLEDADVDVSARAELFDILDVDMGGELSADELVTGLMKLRGDVSKGDIVAIMLQVRHLTHQLEDMADKLDGVKANAGGNAEI